MSALILRRVALLGLILLAVSLLTFAIVNVLPGNVAHAILGETATAEEIRAVEQRLGLDRPLVERYLGWVGAMLRGDFGTSLAFNQPVAPVLLARLWNSAILAALVLAVAVPLSLAVGVACAVFQGSLLDRALSAFAVVAFALPEFVIGLALILAFSIWWPILPGSSLIGPGENPLAQPEALVLPITVLVLHQLAHLSQITRASMIGVLDSNYVRTAELKGLPRLTVIVRHALRNALLPTVAEVGMHFGYVLGGLVVVETLFSYAGIGQLMVMSVSHRDVPTLQATVLVVAAAYGVGNLLADVVSMRLNPRLRS
ncbi:MAG: ABC transporter permease [Alphaproteobacteria bacterium]|nr:ABC transporter permease [Alphaproteobacteria bacterium]